MSAAETLLAGILIGVCLTLAAQGFLVALCARFAASLLRWIAKEARLALGGTTQ